MAKNSFRHLTTYRDTRSIARFGITSVQVRLDGDESKRWESSFVIGGRHYQLQGFADLGRPRGADTDVLIGLEALFSLQGYPASNMVITSGYQLAQAAHMPDNGQTYERIRQSLLRYWRTGFLVREGFHVPGTSETAYYNETLGFFEKISFWESGKRGDPTNTTLSSDKTLRIVLTHEFADSLRSGYTNYLDRALLEHIEQPPARGLYRLLSAHRQNDNATQLSELQVSIVDWRVACGIQDPRASKVLRTLGTAHDELIAQGYLAGVDIEGRGQGTTLNYRFRQNGDPDPALVTQLMAADLRLSLAVAQQLAREHPTNIERAVQFVKIRVNAAAAGTGKHVLNPAGLLRSVLAEPQRYRLDEVDMLPTEHSHGKRLATQRAQGQEKEQQAVRQRFEAQRLALEQAAPEEQWRECRGPFRLLLGKYLNAADWAVLEQRCQAGMINASALLQSATQAVATLELQQFVEELKAELRL